MDDLVPLSSKLCGTLLFLELKMKSSRVSIQHLCIGHEQ